MNRLRFMDLDALENIRIGYLLGMWDYEEFRRKYREMRDEVSGKLIEPEDRPHRPSASSI